MLNGCSDEGGVSRQGHASDVSAGGGRAESDELRGSAVIPEAPVVAGDAQGEGVETDLNSELGEEEGPTPIMKDVQFRVQGANPAPVLPPELRRGVREFTELENMLTELEGLLSSFEKLLNREEALAELNSSLIPSIDVTERKGKALLNADQILLAEMKEKRALLETLIDEVNLTLGYLCHYPNFYYFRKRGERPRRVGGLFSGLKAYQMPNFLTGEIFLSTSTESAAIKLFHNLRDEGQKALSSKVSSLRECIEFFRDANGQIEGLSSEIPQKLLSLQKLVAQTSEESGESELEERLEQIGKKYLELKGKYYSIRLSIVDTKDSGVCPGCVSCLRAEAESLSRAVADINFLIIQSIRGYYSNA